MSKSSDNRIYIGNLPTDVRNKDIEDLFYKYGKIKYIDLKNRRGPPFAFVEFDDPMDAEDAIEGRDGYNFDGYKLRVEIQKGPRNAGAPRPAARSGPPTRRSDYRCIITGLPPTGSWQDLKDHMREAGNVCYADVFKDGTGVVEFIRYDDMKYALKYLDDTKFRSHEGEVGYIRVKSDSKRGRSVSRSRSRSRSRSASYSRKNRSRGGGGGGDERGTPSYSPVRRSRSYDDDDDRRPSRRHKRSYTRSRSRSRSPRHRSRDSKSRTRSRSCTRKTRSSKSTTRSRSRSKSPARAEDVTVKEATEEIAAPQSNKSEHDSPAHE